MPCSRTSPRCDDSKLIRLLAVPTLNAPTLVIWGDSDCIVTPAYGRTYAAAIPGVRFELHERSGHALR
jgi:pimeloyl-ACP methyl ester carboxylesterase